MKIFTLLPDFVWLITKRLRFGGVPDTSFGRVHEEYI